MSMRQGFPGAAAMRQTGRLYALGLDVIRCTFKRPFQFREFVEQAWFITSVTLLPTILVSVPFGAVISLQVGNLTGQLGAQSFAGATAVALVMLVISFVMLLVINALQGWQRKRSGGSS